ncbi:hypothetical protein NMY22_g6991 [Coprinellus aureogranulatus]|nr:hypothetical protein NMY22_g6991 [Coprinellus aureogranulatus]
MPLVIVIRSPEDGWAGEKERRKRRQDLGSRFKSVIPDLRAGRSTGASLSFVIAAIPTKPLPATVMLLARQRVADQGHPPLVTRNGND